METQTESLCRPLAAVKIILALRHERVTEKERERGWRDAHTHTAPIGELHRTDSPHLTLLTLTAEPFRYGGASLRGTENLRALAFTEQFVLGHASPAALLMHRCDAEKRQQRWKSRRKRTRVIFTPLNGQWRTAMRCPFHWKCGPDWLSWSWSYPKVWLTF